MKSINFVVVGDYQIVNDLGKKGTTTDLSIYDRKTRDTIYTWTVPITFPDKIQSLMQAINIAEYAIVNVAKIDKYLGEQILALDAINVREGFIIHSYEVDEEKQKNLIKHTSISDFKLLADIDQLKQLMNNLEPRSQEGDCMIPIDHVFRVKRVGTVVLGVIKHGVVRTFDQLKILPRGKNIIVKSIQMHDDTVTESKSPARVGLAIKGVDADEISRGDVLCSPESLHLQMYYITTSTELLRMRFLQNS
jgi:selenocysteine-specific translation elongation factor